MFHLFIALFFHDRALADPDPFSDMRDDSSEETLESRQQQSNAAFQEELVKEQLLLEEEALEQDVLDQEEVDQLYLQSLQQSAAGEQLILYGSTEDRWADPLQDQIYDPLEEVGIPEGIDPNQLYLPELLQQDQKMGLGTDDSELKNTQQPGLYSAVYGEDLNTLPQENPSEQSYSNSYSTGLQNFPTEASDQNFSSGFVNELNEQGVEGSLDDSNQDGGSNDLQSQGASANQLDAEELKVLQSAIGADVSEELIQSKLSGHYLNQENKKDQRSEKGSDEGFEQENVGIKALIQAEAGPYGNVKKMNMTTSRADALFLQENSSDVYRIGPGDILTIYVWSGDFIEKDMCKNYKVFDSGLVQLPLIGGVNINDKTVAEAAKVIQVELFKFIREPIVHVQVQQPNSQKVGVLGDVKNPGILYLEGPKTLLQALAERGLNRRKKGSGAYAAQKVHLQRKDGSVTIIDLEDLLTNGTNNVFLKNGDTVFVSDGAYVYINGKVNRAGAVPFREGMTVTDAIAEATGYAAGANLRAVYIVRGDERILIDVKDIFQGKAQDVELQNGDRLFVEESIW